MATKDLSLIRLPSDTVVAGGIAMVALRVDCETLTERAGIEWTEVGDDLGAGRVAALQPGADAPPFALFEYIASPGVIVFGDPVVDDAIVDHLLTLLRVEPNEVEDRAGGPDPSPDREDITVALADLHRRVDDLASELSTLRGGSSAAARTADLTVGQRDVLVLIENGHTIAEVAEMLQTTESAVRARHARARRRLHAA